MRDTQPPARPIIAESSSLEPELSTVEACLSGEKARFVVDDCARMRRCWNALCARASAWAVAADFYAGYERYRTSCAPREIRVFRLRPAA